MIKKTLVSSIALAAGAAMTTGAIAASSAPEVHTASHASPEPANAPAPDARAAAISRSQVIARAKRWNPHTSRRVPYSQTRYHGGYRTDCSGYVSMAIGLGKPGPNTVGLAGSRISFRIKMSQLRKGDMIIDKLGNNRTRHVVLFERWANSAHSRYWAYEQRGGYGTDHRTLRYGLTSGTEYRAYRARHVRDDRPKVKPTRAQVIAAAKSWKPHTAQRVRYSQQKTHAGHRRDGSGYASMALRLGKPGANSTKLASRAHSRRIAMSQLKPGDLIINPGKKTRQVVIFAGWTNAQHTAYRAYQQRRGYGTDYLVRRFGLRAGDGFAAFRPLNIR